MKARRQWLEHFLSGVTNPCQPAHSLDKIPILTASDPTGVKLAIGRQDKAMQQVLESLRERKHRTLHHPIRLFQESPLESAKRRVAKQNVTGEGPPGFWQCNGLRR